MFTVIYSWCTFIDIGNVDLSISVIHLLILINQLPISINQIIDIGNLFIDIKKLGLCSNAACHIPANSLPRCVF